MGRRKKAEVYQIIEKIGKLYLEGKTVRQIAKILQDEGYEISKTAVWNAVRDYKKVAQEYKKAYEEAKALIDVVRETPNTDVLESATSLLAKKILDATLAIDQIKGSPHRLIDSLYKLSSSHTRIAGLRLKFIKEIEKEISEIKDDEFKGKSPEEIKEIVLRKIKEVYGG